MPASKRVLVHKLTLHTCYIVHLLHSMRRHVPNPSSTPEQQNQRFQYGAPKEFRIRESNPALPGAMLSQIMKAGDASLSNVRLDSNQGPLTVMDLVGKFTDTPIRTIQWVGEVCQD